MEDPSSIATHPEAVIRKYDGGAPTAADERSKEESTISSSSMFFSYENPCYYLEVVLRRFFSCLGLNRSSDPSSSFSSSSEEEEKEKEVKEKEEKEKEKEESKETITEDVPPPTETEEQTTEDVEGPLLLSGSRALRRPQRPPVGTGRPPQHN
ncbi:structural maintenance of chromosomes protein 4-like [Papaver somniferum]|uniref:structural maintenance of chromosomes protein 4-like n=1 Tax=Papaver somniferum TaxID=3469 RepID=UPI000E6F65C8|nr:structural maintenance of chromosomes protein 4-like [Papaver somniferum]